MDGLTSFKNEIFKTGILIAAVFELASLPFLGLDVQFFYGLALGTAVTIVNFNVMEFALRKTLELRKSAIAVLGFFVRLIIYGIVFYLSIRISLISAAGTALGFLTLKLAMFYLHGLKPKFSVGRTVREEPPELQRKKRWYDYKENDELE